MNMKIDLKVKNKIKLSDLQIAVKKIPPTLQSKTAQAAQETVHITYDENYNGLSFVDIKPVNYTIDENIIPDNIKSGVNILGCEGSLAGIDHIDDASYFFYAGTRWSQRSEYLPLVKHPLKAQSMFNGVFSSNSSRDVILDLNDIDFSDCTNVGNIFYNCGQGKFDNLLGIENLDLSSVDNMDEMFNMFGINLPAQYYSEKDNLDLSNWKLPETSPYRLEHIFQGICKNIPHDFTVNLNNWVLSNTTSLKGFFNNSGISKVIMKDCELKSGDITDVSSMFQNCSRLKEVDISSMCKNKTTSYINMAQMFNGASSLEKVDMRNFRFTLVRNTTGYYNNAFNGVPSNCLIIVKDDAEKQWLNDKFPALTNVQTVSEYEGE